MLSVMGVADEKDPLSRTIWDEMAMHYKITEGHIDFTRYLDNAALKGRRVGVLRDFFGGDPEIDALAEAALRQMESLGAILVDIKLDADFMKRYTGKGQAQIRDTADYRFRGDWEEYAATLPGAPRTVAELIAEYENVVNKSALPATEGTLGLLRDSLNRTNRDPAYIKLVNETLPRATADKLAVFEKHKVDVLVFPYASSFAGVVNNPVYKLEDPTFVKSEVPAPATLAGYNSTGFPSMVVPMGFGTQGLPMGLGFMARPFDDGLLLGYAYAYEQASRQRRPSPLLPALP
jgi:amidase